MSTVGLPNCARMASVSNSYSCRCQKKTTGDQKVHMVPYICARNFSMAYPGFVNASESMSARVDDSAFVVLGEGYCALNGSEMPRR